MFLAPLAQGPTVAHYVWMRALPFEALFPSLFVWDLGREEERVLAFTFTGIVANTASIFLCTLPFLLSIESNLPVFAQRWRSSLCFCFSPVSLPLYTSLLLSIDSNPPCFRSTLTEFLLLLTFRWCPCYDSFGSCLKKKASFGLLIWKNNTDFNLWQLGGMSFWRISRSYNSNTVLSWSDTRNCVLFKPSTIVSNGMSWIDKWTLSHFVSKPSTSSPRKVTPIRVSACHPEVFVDHERDLSATEDSVFCLSLLLLQVNLSFEVRNLDNLLQCCGDPRIKRLEVRINSCKNRSRRLEIVDWCCHFDFFDPWHSFGWMSWPGTHFSSLKFVFQYRNVNGVGHLSNCTSEKLGIGVHHVISWRTVLHRWWKLHSGHSPSKSLLRDGGIVCHAWSLVCSHWVSPCRKQGGDSCCFSWALRFRCCWTDCDVWGFQIWVVKNVSWQAS